MNKDKEWKSSWDNKDSYLVENYEKIHNIYIPRRKDILEIISEYAVLNPNDPKLILDLGAGTGRAVFAILEKYKNAKGILIDGSLPMLEKAKEFANQKNYNIETIYHDLKDPDWIQNCKLDRKYSLIVSSLMIHHLTDFEKLRFFKDIRNLLSEGGIFIYADVLKMEDEYQESISINLWLDEIIQNKIKENEEYLSKEEERENLIHANNEQGDMPGTIKYILDCFKKANFKEFSLIWFYIKFGVFIAKKNIK